MLWVSKLANKSLSSSPTSLRCLSIAQECFKHFTDDRQRMLHIIIIFYPEKEKKEKKIHPMERDWICDPQFKACMIVGRTNWFIFSGVYESKVNSGNRLNWRQEIALAHDIIIRRLRARRIVKIEFDWERERSESH